MELEKTDERGKARRVERNEKIRAEYRVQSTALANVRWMVMWVGLIRRLPRWGLRFFFYFYFHFRFHFCSLSLASASLRTGFLVAVNPLPMYYLLVDLHSIATVPAI